MREHLKFLPWAPVVFLSAKTGKGLGALLDAVDRVHAARRARVTTGELNRLLARATEANAPKAEKGNLPVRILYGSQIGIAPPTFAVSINHPVDLHFSYRRYLENRIREAFGFEGTPIRLKVRYRRRKASLVSLKKALDLSALDTVCHILIYSLRVCRLSAGRAGIFWDSPTRARG